MLLSGMRRWMLILGRRHYVRSYLVRKHDVAQMLIGRERARSMRVVVKIFLGDVVRGEPLLSETDSCQLDAATTLF
jgi:hypothetical protein